MRSVRSRPSSLKRVYFGEFYREEDEFIEAGENLPGAAADFENAAGVVSVDAVDGGVDPFGNLFLDVFRAHRLEGAGADVQGDT